MDTGNNKQYEAPRVEIIEVAVERGFAGSVGSVTVGGWADGGSLGDYDLE